MCVCPRRGDVKKSSGLPEGPSFPPEFRRPGFGEEVTPHGGGGVCLARPCGLSLKLPSSREPKFMKCPLQARYSSCPANKTKTNTNTKQKTHKRVEEKYTDKINSKCCTSYKKGSKRYELMRIGEIASHDGCVGTWRKGRAGPAGARRQVSRAWRGGQGLGLDGAPQ